MTEYRDPYPRVTADGLLGRERAPYLADAALLAAANAALELGMPLLLTGEAGCGKTEFAFALANALCDGAIEAAYVRSDTTARDLLYDYDALGRFGDAHHGGEEGRARAREPRHYIRLNALGRALSGARSTVVLIDEIDKAPRDLPNDLLRELDQHAFTIPEIPPDGPSEEGGGGDSARAAIDPDDPLTYRRTMARPSGAGRPVIVITSNVERQLPDPFLRRCVFFHIRFPEAQLLSILKPRFPDVEPLFLEQVIALFDKLRGERLTKKPGTSELINWVTVLARVYERDWVGRGLRAAEAGIAEGRADRWKTLPGLECLVKLREDQAALLGVGD